MPLRPRPRSARLRLWRRRLSGTWSRFSRQKLLTVSGAAVFVGIAVGLAALGFRLAIEEVQFSLLGSRSQDLSTALKELPWWRIMAAPVIGGLLVGAILQIWGKERPASIADVIDARARLGGRIPVGPGFLHAGLAVVSLGAGASAGREGPVVHLGGGLASLFSRVLGLPPRYARTILACGAAAAVSASFNAPIAGVLFAFEVILGSYALRAMAPVAIASVTGTVVTRLYFGTEDPAFQVPEPELVSYLEMPAFAALGLLAALMAMAMIQSLKWADGGARQIPVPLALRPALGGLVIGAMALQVPEILGVGYGAINAALQENYSLTLLLGLIAAKIIATAVTFASRFGGGVFTPSLYVGAMAGGSFGYALGLLFPDQVTGFGFYAMVGMGAVAAAVLGAPLSTTLIVFELTGGYAITIALLVSASIATIVTQTTLGHSFFQWQMGQRGLDLTVGTYTTVLNTIRVSDFMERVAGAASRIEDSLPVTYPEASLERVLSLLEEHDLESIAVVDRDQPDRLVGIVPYKKALRVYNEALVRTNIEEHQ